MTATPIFLKRSKSTVCTACLSSKPFPVPHHSVRQNMLLGVRTSVIFSAHRDCLMTRRIPRMASIELLEQALFVARQRSAQIQVLPRRQIRLAPLLHKPLLRRPVLRQLQLLSRSHNSIKRNSNNYSKSNNSRQNLCSHHLNRSRQQLPELLLGHQKLVQMRPHH